MSPHPLLSVSREPVRHDVTPMSVSAAHAATRPALTLPLMNQGGSWFTQGACHHAITDSVVEVPCPQAFTGWARSSSHLFPCAPRYRTGPLRETIRPLGENGAPANSGKDFTLSLSYGRMAQHVRVFTSGTSPENPQARFSCQGTRTGIPERKHDVK